MAVRILYIHQYFGTPRDVGGTRSYEQARAMLEAGFEVTMLSSASHLRPDEVPAGSGTCRRGRVGGIDCIVLDIPYNQRMSYCRRIVSFLAFMFWCCRIVLTEPRVDLVYATSTPLTVGVPALLGKLVRGIPYVFEVRDLWPDAPLALGILKPGLIARFLKLSEQMIYRHARMWVPVNDDVASRMRRCIHRAKPAVIVPNACDTYLFDPGRDGQWFRRQHGLEEKILCIHAGAMGPVNGLDWILAAAASLKEYPRLCFVLIGEGREKDRMRQRVEQEEMGNVLVLDAVPKESLGDVLATADIGLMTVESVPVLQMNCANKFADYLASGLPVVLNYRGWQGRMLSEYGAGLSADQGDLEGFTKAIRTLADDDALRQQMGAAGRRLAETDMNRQTVVQPMLKALAELAGSRTLEAAR